MTLGTFFTMMAYVVGAAVFYAAARGRRLATEGVGYVALAGFCGGVLGAKLTEWGLAHWSAFAAQPTVILDPRLGGRTLIGGVIIGWLSVEAMKWRLGIRRSTGDLFALSLPAGEAIGRIGCFFNGCCFGMPTQVPWAVYQHGAWRHPTQLYSSLIALVIFCVLLMARQKLQREGDLFKLYLVLFGFGRFGLEFWRERHIVFGGLSMSQWVCLEMAMGSLLMLTIFNKRVTRLVQAH
ncbi:MAG: prolipoprotein diacylglyceryl transferase [Abitibacteriaceae bacterium]|nr:prolipoprotein diacylglyceryl transferase [Abditibacteriaceae bacterium]